MRSLLVIAGVVGSVALAPATASAQRRSGAMGRAADRAAGPRAGQPPSGPVTGRAAPRTFAPTRIYSPRVYSYRPYYYPYRPGLTVGLYRGYGLPYRYGYYGYPYDYPFNYTYFNNYYPYAAAPYAYPVPPAGYVRAVPGYSYGGLRIQGAPGDAQVFVDGYYMGVVDDFDGAFQHANLRGGPHRIELRAPGMAPVTFDVNVLPGQTITYHAGIR